MIIFKRVYILRLLPNQLSDVHKLEFNPKSFAIRQSKIKPRVFEGAMQLEVLTRLSALSP
jgi:hypothetical protein